MENFIIEVKETENNKNKILINYFYDKLEKKIANKSLKLKNNAKIYKNPLTSLEITNSILENNVNNIFKIANIRFKKNDRFVNANIKGILKKIDGNFFLFISPKFFNSDLYFHFINSADNKKNANVMFLDNNVLKIQRNIIHPHLLNLGYSIPVYSYCYINNKTFFDKYFAIFLKLLIKEHLPVSPYTSVDITMPSNYKSQVKFIENILKLNKINEKPFKNNNSSNSLYYWQSEFKNWIYE
jgi:hypothetical protein